jgi:hypothetical protein
MDARMNATWGIPSYTTTLWHDRQRGHLRRAAVLAYISAAFSPAARRGHESISCAALRMLEGHEWGRIPFGKLFTLIHSSHQRYRHYPFTLVRSQRNGGLIFSIN